MTLSAFGLQRCQWALRGGYRRKISRHSHMAVNHSTVGLCPCNLRIAPQCSMPFEKGSRIASRNFLPLYLIVVPAPTFFSGVASLVSSQGHIPIRRSFSCHRRKKQKSRYTIPCTSFPKRIDYPLGFCVVHNIMYRLRSFDPFCHLSHFTAAELPLQVRERYFLPHIAALSVSLRHLT